MQACQLQVFGSEPYQNIVCGLNVISVTSSKYGVNDLG